ncbi:hypothetical protein ISN44_As12g002430 [Arabidopsis suecica]|uniref:Uncharacterized protein n=1 Tax=Arabidopsis suecica TaxID=45249 RepID=A0A8T1YF51_ARASU|nr:hypothetical protein ISN44_As12g002430 [Arabidopsis suecica]
MLSSNQILRIGFEMKNELFLKRGYWNGSSSAIFSEDDTSESFISKGCLKKKEISRREKQRPEVAKSADKKMMYGRDPDQETSTL